MREHRGHGLGFAMKVANLVAMEERYPSVRRINTWNAEENAAMIAVNEEIGCRVEARSAYWHRPIGPPTSAPDPPAEPPVPFRMNMQQYVY